MSTPRPGWIVSGATDAPDGLDRLPLGVPPTRIGKALLDGITTITPILAPHLKETDDGFTHPMPSWSEWAMRIWTAVLPHAHTRISELCPDHPWPDLKTMNQGMLQLWNESMGPEDEVLVIGDFTMGRIQKPLDLTPLLHPRQFLAILGTLKP